MHVCVWVLSLLIAALINYYSLEAACVYWGGHAPTPFFFFPLPTSGRFVLLLLLFLSLPALFEFIQPLGKGKERKGDGGSPPPLFFCIPITHMTLFSIRRCEIKKSFFNVKAKVFRRKGGGARHTGRRPTFIRFRCLLSIALFF